MTKAKCLVIIAALAAFWPGAGHAAGVPTTFTTLTGFPSSQGWYAPCDSLSDNRIIAYDGDAVWIQDAAGQDAFTKIAEGYSGDPAFIAVSPDGKTALLGAGSNTSMSDTSNDYLYLLDLENPVDYTPGAELTAIPSNFSAVWLTSTLILVESNPTGYMWGADAELGIIDLAAGPPTYNYKQVIYKGGYSAALGIDRAYANIYATLVNFVDPVEVRRFTTQALINAYRSKATLSWTDGTLIGDPTTTSYNSWGCLGVSTQGSLILGGGPVQFVDATTGAILGTADPEGSGWMWYTGGTYLRNGQVVLTDGAGAYVSDDPWEALPVMGGVGLLALTGAIAILGHRRLRR